MADSSSGAWLSRPPPREPRDRGRPAAVTPLNLSREQQQQQQQEKTSQARTGSPGLAASPGSRESSVPTPASSGRSGTADIVQFSCPLYFAEEMEDTVKIQIMRLGSLKGEVTVSYATEDISARAGLRYVATAGKVRFADGESSRYIQVKIVEKKDWAPTLEFKIKLSDPDNCYLGLYLQSCIVKVIDDDIFPSDKYYDEMTRQKDGVRNVNSYGLFWEYCKMNFQQTGIYWKTIVTLVFDQLHNAHTFLRLTISAYLVNVVFNTHANPPNDHALLVDSNRIATAAIIGGLYVFPILVLHIWDYVKIRMDIQGHTQVFLSSCLFRKYLNYSEESRQYVAPSEMQLGLLTETGDLAKGYTAMLEMAKLMGKLVVMLFFVMVKEPGALWLVVLMPLIIALFAWLRGSGIAVGRREKDKREREMIAVIAQTCEKYLTIKHYFRRSARSEMFAQKSEFTRRSELPVNVVMTNNLYACRWLGPVFICLYICLTSPLVLNGNVPLGFFLATISILENMSGLFLDVYSLYQELTEVSEPLNTLCVYFNLPTDLRPFKKSTEDLVSWMGAAREDAMKKPAPPPEAQMMRTDLIPILLDSLFYNYESERIINNYNMQVPQGYMVCISGDHGVGKKTLLQLLGRTMVPHKGNVYIPPHLRVLFVEQEPCILLDLSLWENLTMGCHNGIATDIVRSILQEMGMTRVLKALEYFEGSLGAPVGDTASDSMKQEDTAREHSSRDLLLPDNKGGVPRTKSEDADANSAKQRKMIDWFETINYTEKARIHLARAFIMNPEVMVLHRPLFHFGETAGKQTLAMILQHHRNRGLSMPMSTLGRRRPRTVFMSTDAEWQEEGCDVIWHMEPRTNQLESREPKVPRGQADICRTATGHHSTVVDSAREAREKRAREAIQQNAYVDPSMAAGKTCVSENWMSDMCFASKQK